MSVSRFSLGLCCVLMLAACGTPRGLKDPAYAPPAPPVPESKSVPDGAIYHAASNVFLFEDIKARRVGDSITVILQEQTNASKSASTATQKSSEIDMPSPTAFGRLVTRNGREILVTDIESDTQFSGKGDSSQSNSLTGNITVTVTEVMPNGNLHVRGEKILTLNQGSEVVRIAGIIRQRDISPQNTVLSTQIAAAEITYSGDGAVASSNRHGWLTRFFNSKWWPF